LFSAIILNSSPDTTVELTTQNDQLLTDATHLILEINVDGDVISEANLLPQDASPLVWNADEVLAV
jgi:hypothetical protein